ncbi:MAG TPA: T9SS type A sorting domain-containing protein [Saprospiraceae bacterium]|nr:T9SS type A sorting domain-containing protein [Saprospiraceae bacterium]
MLANATATPQTSNGVDDGTATANPTGGTSGYSYSWSNGGSTQTITGLAPGSYSVTVTDANGCTDVKTVTVNSFNCALSAAISGTNATCFGANNGTAEVALTGAADPVVYAWSNGANTQTVANLTPGQYTVSVTDGNNCPASLNINITEPLQLAANATATNESFAGANDGTASANPTGGTSGYTYLWSNSATTQAITNLAPGSYTVTVTDANGCTDVKTTVVNSFNCVIDVATTILNVTCAGANNGSVTLALNGGTAPFTYSWSNGGNSATISNLPGGEYTASVTDANGCQIISTATVTEPAPYSPWTVETVSPVCANDATGSATVSISGGTTPYNFEWSNGQNSNTASNLTAGTYTVTVTDQNGCQKNTSVSLVALDIVPPTVSVQNASIPIGASGIAEVTLSVLAAQLADNCGVASSNISPNAFNCTQLGQHEVTVTVTDQSGLTATATATVTVVDNSAPAVTCPANLIRCASENVVTYDAPVAVDNCLGNGGEWHLENGLPSGSTFPVGTTTQTYTYTDAGGNIGACSFSVNVIEQVELNNVSVTNDVNNQAVGAIDITVSGGGAPYTFKWTKDGLTIGDTEDLTGLSSGNYTVVVTDANGCIVTKTDIKVDNTTGTQEPSWLKGVRLQPNPTNGLTRIVFNQQIASMLEVSVIDATGRVLLNEISENPAVVTIDCSNLPEGMYVVRFSTGAEVGAKKLMVSH